MAIAPIAPESAGAQPGRDGVRGEQVLDHYIVYTSGQLYNPATGVRDHEDQGMTQNVAIVLPGGSRSRQCGRACGGTAIDGGIDGVTIQAAALDAIEWSSRPRRPGERVVT